MKAVVFDLWDTLVEWPVAEAEVLNRDWPSSSRIDADEFERRWRDGYRPRRQGRSPTPIARSACRTSTSMSTSPRVMSSREGRFACATAPRDARRALRERGVKLG